MIDGWIHVCMDKNWIEGWRIDDGRTDERKEYRMDGWMDDGWTDG